jgi:hypothetical protein
MILKESYFYPAYLPVALCCYLYLDELNGNKLFEAIEAVIWSTLLSCGEDKFKASCLLLTSDLLWSSRF